MPPKDNREDGGIARHGFAHREVAKAIDIDFFTDRYRREATVNTLTKARFEIESFDAVDNGLHPVERVLGVPVFCSQLPRSEACEMAQRQS